MDEVVNNQVPDTIQPVQPAKPVSDFNVTLNLPFLKSFTGWATFKAVMDIIGGALACLGIITAAYGIPKIISGVRLLSAVDDFKKYMVTNRTLEIETAFNNLYKHFKLSGISVIVQISFTIIFLVLYGIFIFYMLRNMPNVLDSFPGGYYY